MEYSAKAIEDKWQKFWSENKSFEPEDDKSKEKSSKITIQINANTQSFPLFDVTLSNLFKYVLNLFVDKLFSFTLISSFF